jgi:hypothetical protein
MRWVQSKSKLNYDRQLAGQSVLVSGTHLRPATNFSHSLFDYFLDNLEFVDVGLPLWREVGVCTFHFLPGIASAAFLRYEYHGIHKQSLLSLLLRLPQTGGPGSCIYFLQEQRSPVIPPGIGLWVQEMWTELNLRRNHKTFRCCTPKGLVSSELPSVRELFYEDTIVSLQQRQRTRYKQINR